METQKEMQFIHSKPLCCVVTERILRIHQALMEKSKTLSLRCPHIRKRKVFRLTTWSVTDHLTFQLREVVGPNPYLDQISLFLWISCGLNRSSKWSTLELCMRFYNGSYQSAQLFYWHLNLLCLSSSEKGSCYFDACWMVMINVWTDQKTSHHGKKKKSGQINFLLDYTSGSEKILLRFKDSGLKQIFFAQNSFLDWFHPFGGECLLLRHEKKKKLSQRTLSPGKDFKISSKDYKLQTPALYFPNQIPSCLSLSPSSPPSLPF